MLGAEGIVLVIWANDGHSNSLPSFDDNVLREGERHESDVTLPFEERSRSRAYTFVDAVNALEQPFLSPIVYVGRQLLSLAGPGLLQGIAERLQLVDQLGMGHVEWTILTNLSKFRWIEVLVIMVRGTLVEVVFSVLPVPVAAAIFSPVIVRCRATADPGVVVDRAATA